MYHFIGIKGSGMSALAIIMKQLGYKVQGSDNKNHYFFKDDFWISGAIRKANKLGLCIEVQNKSTVI